MSSYIKSDNLPTAMDIAMSVISIKDYTPIAELAKDSLIINGSRGCYYRVTIGGIDMPAWQAEIAKAQFMLLLADLSK